jgi:nicotinamidase/pyrazinamidase
MVRWPRPAPASGLDGPVRLTRRAYHRAMGKALIIVDFQNDFTPPAGALAVPEGDRIAERVNELARSGRFDLVVATRDWHPPDHGSFDRHGGVWPAHCVADTEGAELHDALEREHVDVVMDKGQHPETEGYSAFEGTELARLLRERGVDSLTVVGLATDYCVKNTALDALREGFRVAIDSEAVRGVDVNPGDSDAALQALRAAGATVVAPRT